MGVEIQISVDHKNITKHTKIKHDGHTRMKQTDNKLWVREPTTVFRKRQRL